MIESSALVAALAVLAAFAAVFAGLRVQRCRERALGREQMRKVARRLDEADRAVSNRKAHSHVC